MITKEWFQKWNFKSLKIKASFLEAELVFNDTDKKAAWEMYVELLTRITTQPLDKTTGDEQTALNSVFSLLGTTREILKSNGSTCVNFTKVSIIILNQIIRPFTTKWHKKSIEGAFANADDCEEFRKALELVRIDLTNFIGLLSEIAEVEDLTELAI